MIYNEPVAKKGETWVLNESPDWRTFALEVTGITNPWNTIQIKFISNGVVFDGITVYCY
jgi:hypothetical protein